MSVRGVPLRASLQVEVGPLPHDRDPAVTCSQQPLPGPGPVSSHVHSTSWPVLQGHQASRADSLEDAEGPTPFELQGNEGSVFPSHVDLETTLHSPFQPHRPR